MWEQFGFLMSACHIFMRLLIRWHCLVLWCLCFGLCLHLRILTDDKSEGVGSSEEDQDNSGGETELPGIDPRAEDRELKNHLLKKYSGYLSSLKQELSKKKKKGKLPKEARQKLLSWWELHYKWPYPSVCLFSFQLKYLCRRYIKSHSNFEMQYNVAVSNLNN